ncbi:hypothetical protein [Mucilaginibacter sp. KACC 22063]|uniref:hypothetical protein n=1 Tax=Mucilaginibacter sp. KACC 22063 TaxID=3025666 RepID=UPI0023673C2D|nr:hypothetical protein [Mucilaginibacter sp. KACC 22063]WDF54927.1 hypothetical protein PQ461_18520 [Mucilaginibacter sp. KACC 22063]
MEEKQLREDLLSIRSMMERSSKFLSLSGLSGILAGVYALAGAAATYIILHKPAPADFISGLMTAIDDLNKIVLIAISVLIASIITGVALTYRKARKQCIPMWGKTSRNLLFNMAVPLITGGVLVLVLLNKGELSLLLPTTLIFYGLALVNAGNFTYTDVKYLGLCEIIIGLIGACFPGYGLVLWAIGFGILHIVYGSVMYFKYDRENTV